MSIGKFGCLHCGPSIVGHKVACPYRDGGRLKNKRYAVWGSDKSYRFLWMAALAAGLKAAKVRYYQGPYSKASCKICSLEAAFKKLDNN